ncbi:ABC transporter ATP-binding protein [Salicibibacter cibarius]|uniref:ABC transporter ATP-binding protein n=1 Tax=Salicibibacter cibarius TaxID=2743000 RepID=A0A7T6Z0P9_9BACI|nr:ABC transporter ATP-binding protein [Salicibibacter cibarius]QQK74850.1 ABC transporter ATP-binding protein [Salicibibacter cibarius]
MEIVLESKQLSKGYRVGKDHQHVLKNVDVQIKKEEFVTVMGPSGSGKSTLLYNISGMDRMTAGRVIFDGQEISTLSETELSKLRLHHMGFIFQGIHLLKNLSIFDNIILSAYLAKKSSRHQINERALELMQQTGIADLAHHDIMQASGGQLQRVGICRALINHPKMIFADEPTGALNSKSAAEIMDILADINQTGTTILLVTHDVKVAAKTERILYMVDGNIVGEKLLGKYNQHNNEMKTREEKLSKWLMEMGF